MSTSTAFRRHWAGVAFAALMAGVLSYAFWNAAASHTLVPAPGPSLHIGTPVHLETATDQLLGNSQDGQVFAFANLKPGDARSASLTVTMSDPQGAATVSLTEQNLSHAGPAGSGDLSTQLTLSVLDTTTSKTVYSGTFNGLVAPTQVCGSSGSGCSTWSVGESHNFTFTVSVPQGLGNAYQGTQAMTDLVWTAAGSGQPNVTITKQTGNSFKVQPGDDMAAGWSFQIPTNHVQTAVTFQAAQVTFFVKCAGGGAPTAPSFTLNLQPGPFTDPLNSTLWYPNGNGAAHESYENATQPSPAPALCGPGGTMIATNVTFQTFLSANPVVPSVSVRFHYTDGGTIDCSNGATNPGAGTAACNGGWSSTLNVAPASG